MQDKETIEIIDKKLSEIWQATVPEFRKQFWKQFEGKEVVLTGPIPLQEFFLWLANVKNLKVIEGN